jgi:2-hydroxychromene-2-carboxylate isomerase
MASFITKALTAALTSPARRNAMRALRAAHRRLTAQPATIHYFHDPADPYSHLTAQLIAALATRYRINLTPHLVPPPDKAAAPDAARLTDWSLRDAPVLAEAYDLQFPPSPTLPSTAALEAHTTILAAALGTGDFIDTALRAGADLWSGNPSPLPSAPPGQTQSILEQGAALRRKLGHYLGATFYFEGEWYWGIDRLHHLEARLTAQGLDNTPARPRIAPARDVTLANEAGAATGNVLQFFLSFRSPYTYISVARARALAAHYGAELRLRYVLPMVMRGLPVPATKRLYITLDTKREAERLNLPFGTIADPVGPGVERGLAVLQHAIATNRGPEFCQSFLQGVFAEGIDAATDAGLQKLAARANISPAEVTAALADTAWRTVAEQNRQEMLEAGLWGVPCFRVDRGPMVWGQDRLWVIEKELAQAAHVNAVAAAG